MKTGLIQDLIRGFAIVIFYVATAKLGLHFHTVSGYASLLWAPSGISLAALTILGLRFWPAVFLGGFLSNASWGGSIFIPFGIAIGSSLEALLGASFLVYSGFQPRLGRLDDLLKLLFVATLSTIVSATIGVFTLQLANIIVTNQFTFTWTAWWVGDLIGELLGGALIFVIAARVTIEMNKRKILEAALLTTFIFLSTFTLFNREPSGVFPLTYCIFPGLLWTAIRFKQLGSVLACITVAGIAVWKTGVGSGPFAMGNTSEGLIHLQLFMAVISATTLLVSAAVAQADEAIRIRDEFLSVASHELKTPLTSLQLQLQFLMRMAKSGTTPDSNKIQDTLEKSTRQMARISNLINELLDISRIEAGKLVINFEEMNFSDLIGEVVDRHSEQLSNARCELKVTIDEHIVGRWDRMRVEQVLVNLLSNGIKYAPGTPIHITAARIENKVRLTVQDFGPGIDKESQTRIFNRFERVPGTKDIGGLGLGLFIIKQIIDAHHGIVFVESELQKGSKFVVELPVDPTALASTV